MSRKKGENYHVLISVRNGNFEKVDEKTFSGPTAIVDAMYYLDEKYDPAPLEIIKRFW